MQILSNEVDAWGNPLDYFRWLLKNPSISRYCCTALCDNMCSGLGINDLVIFIGSPSRWHASFIYHQKCLSATCFFIHSADEPFSLFEHTKGDVFVFYWLTRNTVNTMMCSPVVSEVIRMLNGSNKKITERMMAINFHHFIWFASFFFAVVTFDRCWIMVSLRFSSHLIWLRWARSSHRHCFQE